MTGPTNDEFLKAVFHAITEDERCWITQFKDSPTAIGGAKWGGQLHDPMVSGEWSPECNTYFAIASFPKDAPSRQAQHANAVHCIVLDDIGQKVPMSVLDTLPSPSWMIETSAGSNQVGWILATPAACGEARLLLDSLGKADLGDKGGQNVVRYLRCPVGINNKPTALSKSGQAFSVKTIQWYPEKTIEFAIIECALHAAIDATQVEKALSKVEQIPAPAPHHDPVVAFLRIKTMLLCETPNASGYLEIRCPFESEHTNAGGTGYRPASALKDAHFNCFHSHGPTLSTDRFHQRCIEEGLDKEAFQKYRHQVHAALAANNKSKTGEHVAEFQFDATTSPLGLTPLNIEPPAPQFVIDGLLPDATVGVVAGPGGIGKTTRRMHQGVHIVLGRDYCGRKVLNPGPVIYITGEDTRAESEYRLHHICAALGLSPEEKLVVARDFHIVDVVGSGMTFIQTQSGGDFVATSAIQDFITAYAEVKPRVVIVDPKISFSTGSEDDNTASRKFMDASSRIAKSLRCCVIVVHHVSKEMARNKTVDQYVGRGGSAIADAARFVVVEVPHSVGDKYRDQTLDLPLGIDSSDVAAGNVVRLHVEKMSYAPRPTEPFWMVRRGFKFQFVQAIYPDAETHFDRIERVVVHLKQRRANNLFDSRNNIELSYKDLGMSRNAVRQAVTDGLQIGMLTEKDLPSDKKKGGFKKAISIGAVTYQEAKKNSQQPAQIPPIAVAAG
jgi:hypothetical protein